MRTTKCVLTVRASAGEVRVEIAKARGFWRWRPEGTVEESSWSESGWFTKERALRDVPHDVRLVEKYGSFQMDAPCLSCREHAQRVVEHFPSA